MKTTVAENFTAARQAQRSISNKVAAHDLLAVAAGLLDVVRRMKVKGVPEDADTIQVAKKDAADLGRVALYIRANDFGAAMKVAEGMDTAVRDMIPGDVWKLMGGELTASGEAALRKQQQKRKGQLNRFYDIVDRVDMHLQDAADNAKEAARLMRRGQTSSARDRARTVIQLCQGAIKLIDGRSKGKTFEETVGHSLPQE